MKGWKIKDKDAKHTYSFPSSYTLEPKNTVTLSIVEKAQTLQIHCIGEDRKMRMYGTMMEILRIFMIMPKNLFPCWRDNNGEF